MHAYGHDVEDRWLLKDDTEANEVMESGNGRTFGTCSATTVNYSASAE